jgi:hypothetical protein
MTPVLTPEDELCLLLTRGQLNPEERTRVLQFLATRCRGLSFWNAPKSPGVSALYCNLRDLGIPSVPEAVQAELKGPLSG